MNRQEALHTLGLGSDATPEDIRAAYKESAQILHPDKFAGNKRLQNRATEQFKNLQEAYEFLTKGSGGEGAGAGDAAGPESPPGTGAGSRRRGYTRTDELRARLAGIDAAREQIVAQRDALLDSRRTGWMLVVGGLLVAVLARRLRPIAALAGAAVVWGVVDLVSTGRNLEAVNKQLANLKKEKNAILDELAEEE